MRKIMIANGQYTAKDGQQKTNWVKVGMVGVSGAGKEYILLDPTINLAGFPRDPGKDMIICSVFEDQPQQGQPQGQQQQGYHQAQPQQQPIYTPPPAQAQQQQTAPAYNPPPAQGQQQIPVVDVNEEQIPF